MSHKNLHSLDCLPANYWQLELKIGFKISTVLVGKHSWAMMPPPLLNFPKVKRNNCRYFSCKYFLFLKIASDSFI